MFKWDSKWNIPDMKFRLTMKKIMFSLLVKWKEINFCYDLLINCLCFLWKIIPCVKSDLIRSCSGPHFPAFGLNTERNSVSLRTQSECGKMWTRITPNTYTFYAVITIRNKKNFPFLKTMEKFARTDVSFWMISFWGSVYITLITQNEI